MQTEQSPIPQLIGLLLFFRSTITRYMLAVSQNACIVLFLTVSLLGGAGAQAEELERPHTSSELQTAAMPLLPDSRVGRILRQYYDSGLGGRGGWAQVSSLRLQGRFSSQGEHFTFTAYRKKPDLFKYILKSDEREIIYGYDGTRAWTHRRRPASAPQLLQRPDGDHLISNALFGSHLLYPYAAGKVIRYIDTLPFQGRLCDLLQVELGNGHRLDYYLDLHTHREVRRTSLEPRSGHRLSLDFADYDSSGPIPIPTRVVFQSDAQPAGSLELERIQFNPGIMPWMFQQP